MYVQYQIWYISARWRGGCDIWGGRAATCLLLCWSHSLILGGSLGSKEAGAHFTSFGVISHPSVMLLPWLTALQNYCSSSPPLPTPAPKQYLCQLCQLVWDRLNIKVFYLDFPFISNWLHPKLNFLFPLFQLTTVAQSWGYRRRY